MPSFNTSVKGGQCNSLFIHILGVHKNKKEVENTTEIIPEVLGSSLCFGALLLHLWHDNVRNSIPGTSENRKTSSTTM